MLRVDVACWVLMLRLAAGDRHQEAFTPEAWRRLAGGERRRRAAPGHGVTESSTPADLAKWQPGCFLGW
ncbi:MAG: hypothetical protein ABI779_22920, partial [Acidobacteriota bacterium]